MGTSLLFSCHWSEELSVERESEQRKNKNPENFGTWLFYRKRNTFTKWFAGRTSPGIAPVLFAGRQARHLLNSSENFFFSSLGKKKISNKNSRGCQLHFSHRFCLKQSPGYRGVYSQGSPSGSLDSTKTVGTLTKVYRHVGTPWDSQHRRKSQALSSNQSTARLNISH